MDFVDHIRKTVAKTNGGNDDHIDRISWKITAILLVLFSVIVSATQYVGEPIECWCPAEFTGNYIKWAERLCWIKNTYYVPVEDDVPKDEDLKEQLVYYQWTPFILLFQAFFFVVPQVIWKSIINQAGFSIKNITEAGQVFSMATKVEEREQTVKYIMRQLDYYLGMRRKRQQSVIAEKLKIFCNKRKGNFLVFSYIIIKLLYIGNCVGQFYLLSVLLGTDFISFGKNVIGTLTNGTQIPDSPYFPRVTLCDFRVRSFPRLIRPYTVECVLSINLFNEKIFIFIWFWLWIVMTLSILSFIAWVLRMAIPQARERLVRRYVKIFSRTDKLRRKRDFRAFVHKYLRDDGVFIIRMLSLNASDLVAGEVVSALWENFDPRQPGSADEEAPLDDI